MNAPLVLKLERADAILLRCILMVQIQMLRPESRTDTQKILDTVNEYIQNDNY